MKKKFVYNLYLFLKILFDVKFLIFDNIERLSLDLNIEGVFVVLNGVKYKILKESYCKNTVQQALFIRVQDSRPHPLLGMTRYSNDYVVYKRGTTNINVLENHSDLKFKVLGEADNFSYLETVAMQEDSKFFNDVKLLKYTKLSNKDTSLHQLLSIKDLLDQTNEENIKFHIPVKYMNNVDIVSDYVEMLKIKFPKFLKCEAVIDSSTGKPKYILLEASHFEFKNWVFVNASLINEDLLNSIFNINDVSIMAEVCDSGAFSFVEFKESGSNLVLSQKLSRKVQDYLVENKQDYSKEIFEIAQEQCCEDIKNYNSLCSKFLLDNE